MSNPGDWITNDGARAHFLRLTQDTGIFLENRLAELASAFATSSTKRKAVRVSAESVTYGRDTEESPLRQIDQLVQFYKEFVLDDRTGIQLIMNVPIEAKYRRDVETCAVSYPTGSYRPALPIVSDLHGSSLGATLRTIKLFEGYKLSQPVFIEVEEGITPKRIFGENLVFSAAAALYDFIHFACAEHSIPIGESFIKKARLLERFEKYLAEKHYAWWAVILEWMNENLSSSLVARFNQEFLPDRCYFGVNVFIPVLFMNGPIHDLENATNKEAPVFRSCDAIITRVRVPRWPGRLRRDLLGYTAEAPLIITNQSGLAQLLTSCLDGFLAFETCLKRARPILGERWPIEAAFYQMALDRFLTGEESGVRSDLDVFHWLH
jgi:hypothetical protein